MKKDYYYEPTRSERLSKITTTTKFGDLTAQIKYDWDYHLGNLTLAVAQQGKPIFETLVARSIVSNSGVSVSIRLIDLNNDEDPAVIIKHNSGTSGCCNHTLIYYFDYKKDTFNHIHSILAREALTIEDIDGDGIWEIQSRGEVFESLYGALTPTLIQHFVHGEFINVTREFPKRIRKNNERLRKALMAPKDQPSVYEKIDRRSRMAAYLANKYMLGEGEEGWDTLKKVYQESDRKEFFDKLEKWLKKGGHDQR